MNSVQSNKRKIIFFPPLKVGSNLKLNELVCGFTEKVNRIGRSNGESEF